MKLSVCSPKHDNETVYLLDNLSISTSAHGNGGIFYSTTIYVTDEETGKYSKDYYCSIGIYKAESVELAFEYEDECEEFLKLFTTYGYNKKK